MEGEKQRALPAACGDAARLKGLPESCEEKKWRRCSVERMPESCEEKKFLLIVTGGRIINQMLCRHGGTGRRAGLKIPFWQQSAGSIPAGGTFTRTLCFQRKWLQTLKIQGFLILKRNTVFTLRNVKFIVFQKKCTRKCTRHTKLKQKNMARISSHTRKSILLWN